MTTLRGRVVMPDTVLDDAVVELRAGLVHEVRSPRVGDPPASALSILPGFVDLHCHGGGGASFTTADPEQIATAAAHHRAQGTTAVLGSAVTDAPDRLLAVVSALADAVDAGQLVGVHAEGPFLSAARCGAQDPRFLRSPDRAFTAELVAAARGHLRVMTLAPELPGAGAVADLLDEHDVIAAVGHTEASAALTRAFLARRPPGRALVTHLYNGMPPSHHRDPGPVLGALAAAADGTAVVEVIGDGVHVADATVAGVAAIAGPRLALVTDAMAAAGMPDGTYGLGPQKVAVRDGVARLVEGDSIAGGTSRLLDVVRRQVSAGLDLAAIAQAASTTPAKLLGLPGGAVEAGRPADLVVVDGAWQVQQVLVSGTPVR